MADPKKNKLLNAYTEYTGLESAFEDSLDEAQEGPLCELRKSYDWYDSSVEFYDAPSDMRLREAAQRVCLSHGFSIAFVNHVDGWETHYTLTKDLPVEGWRVRYGNKQKPPTNFVEVERLPESWPKSDNVIVVAPVAAPQDGEAK